MATTSKITEREIMNAVIDGTIDTDVLIAYAEKRIAALDKRTASAQKRAAAKRAESDEITQKLGEVLTTEPQNRDQLAAALVELGYEVTGPKVSARMRGLVESGVAEKVKIKTKGEDGKTRETTGYVLA